MKGNEKSGIDWWLSLIRDRDPKVRRKAAQALGEIHPPKALKPLTAALHDPDYGVRAHAVMALARFSEPAAWAALLEPLSDPSDEVRKCAALALGTRSDPAVTGPMIRTASPGPGKGCRSRTREGSPSSLPADARPRRGGAADSGPGR